MNESRPLLRRERERCIKRREMLDAAKAVFAEKSYADATVDEIAERAEFGKGTIYLYFKGGKQEILAALLDELFEEVHAHLDALVSAARSSAGGSRGLLEDYLRWLVQHLAENQELFIVSVKEADRSFPGEHEGGQVRWGDRFDGVIALLAEFFDIAAGRGEIRPADPIALAHVFFGMVRGYLTMAFSTGVNQDARHGSEVAREAVEFLGSLLYDGVACE